jgi:uncharacterized repeat protein (TIGR02543 family)
MLGYVLTNAAGVVVRSDTPGTLIGASSPVESDGFLHPGDNLISQQSGADYTAAMGSLRGAIDSVKTNILPHATFLTSESLSNLEVIPDQLGIFPAGIYATTGAMSIAANQQITLTGDANSVFVFISGEAFNVGANVQILLDGGVQAKNVYWVIGSFVGAHTAGASSTLVGNYLVDGTMSVGASTHITGRILAMNTITFGALAHLDALPPATSCGASVMADTKTIEFTDTTLVDGTRGQVYSDYVSARTLFNGTADSQTVTYSVSPSLTDLGLNMSTAGVVTGTVLSTATLGTHSFTVSALSVGYVAQTYVFPLVIKAAAVVPPVVVPDSKTIEFTDITLNDGTRGQAYSDYVAARTLLNGTADSHSVTYSISPSLSPLGLSMDTAGILTGTVLDSATVGTHSHTVSAWSNGYVTQTYVYPIVIKAAAVVPRSYSISYHSNSSTSGSAPALTTGSGLVQLRSNSGLLARTGYKFIGWNTKANGTGKTYASGSTFTLSSNVALYAKWSVVAKKKSVSATTYFASGSSVLSVDAKKKLLKSFGKILPKVTSGTIVGYVQRDGNHGNDQKLSTARAKSVAKYLTSKGIKVQLKIIGKGVLNSSKESRRVTVTLNYSE